MQRLSQPTKLLSIDLRPTAALSLIDAIEEIMGIGILAEP